MIKIFICDDELIHLEAIRQVIERGILFSKITTKIELATTEPEKIMDSLDKLDRHELNVYFLDIDLSHEIYDGLKLAMKIREKDPFGFIIFITSHIEFGFLTFEYKLGAFDYIVKTDSSELLKNKIISTLKAIEDRWNVNLQNNEEQSAKIKFISDYEEKFIPVNELIALEIVGNHKLQIISKYKIFESNGTLGKIENKLPNSFFRCHRSSIINLKEVVSVSKKGEIVTMSNGIEIQCSKRQQKKFLQLLKEINS
jgi:two-component system response regulator AgrA